MTESTPSAAPRNTEEQLVRQARVRHTPCGLHPYTATLKGRGIYGYGNTPALARDCLRRLLKYLPNKSSSLGA